MKPCFAVDKSLGTLAKWLRILGYDTLYEADASSGEFYARLEDHRILITRTRKIQKAFASSRRPFLLSNSNRLWIKSASIRPTSNRLQDAFTATFPLAKSIKMTSMVWYPITYGKPMMHLIGAVSANESTGREVMGNGAWKWLIKYLALGK